MVSRHSNLRNKLAADIKNCASPASIQADKNVSVFIGADAVRRVAICGMTCEYVIQIKEATLIPKRTVGLDIKHQDAILSAFPHVQMMSVRRDGDTVGIVDTARNQTRQATRQQ